MQHRASVIPMQEIKRRIAIVDTSPLCKFQALASSDKLSHTNAKAQMKAQACPSAASLRAELTEDFDLYAGVRGWVAKIVQISSSCEASLAYVTDRQFVDSTRTLMAESAGAMVGDVDDEDWRFQVAEVVQRSVVWNTKRVAASDGQCDAYFPFASALLTSLFTLVRGITFEAAAPEGHFAMEALCRMARHGEKLPRASRRGEALVCLHPVSTIVDALSFLLTRQRDVEGSHTTYSPLRPDDIDLDTDVFSFCTFPCFEVLPDAFARLDLSLFVDFRGTWCLDVPGLLSVTLGPRAIQAKVNLLRESTFAKGHVNTIRTFTRIVAFLYDVTAMMVPDHVAVLKQDAACCHRTCLTVTYRPVTPVFQDPIAAWCVAAATVASFALHLDEGAFEDAGLTCEFHMSDDVPPFFDAEPVLPEPVEPAAAETPSSKAAAPCRRRRSRR